MDEIFLTSFEESPIRRLHFQNTVPRMAQKYLRLVLFISFVGLVSFGWAAASGHQPLAKIAIHRTTLALHESASIKVSPVILGLKGEKIDWVRLKFSYPNPTADDWVGVFSPANFSASICNPEVFSWEDEAPFLCTSPIKFQYATYSNPSYTKTGTGSLKLQLINQRADFSFGLFTGGILNPKLVAVSDAITFANPKAPAYPRLAQGRSWNEITVTWTSGYDIKEAVPFVAWGMEGETQTRSPAGTLTFTRNSMCGSPARTVGWRDPGFIHTSFLKDLWPNLAVLSISCSYKYQLGHKLLNGSYVWSQVHHFKAPPYPGQDSLQRVVIFGDMGKAERDGSTKYNDFEYGSLNTTDQLIKDLQNIDMVLHIGDISYADGYLSQWDQFTAQIEPIASTVPYMIANGNHERDWPGSGSFYTGKDSGGECGVLAQTMFYVPAENREKFWYSTDYGMFRFCIADSEHDWRPGTEQYRFIEHCFATADRLKQPWLVFIAHRVLGYSSYFIYALDGSFGEPMGRESLQGLWQKYKVDLAIFGHIHGYERTCPIYENKCMSTEKSHYKGPFNGTINVVAGGGGAIISSFSTLNTSWSLFKDADFGFLKLTALDHSSLLAEYKRSKDDKETMKIRSHMQLGFTSPLDKLPFPCSLYTGP
ncbi:probable inactive purple acid phosphatase 27 isoform X3 [Nymphaea colorata]|uniref:probable inactive purple acid phosphatase 27 isoform X3 n=1 Tax=Nymphaea colorata TaxID=210225 RepID=UPI00214E8129|nr:probable inactive purple acid phosphatase 27 isoform X3 [Nymphaea colorata]